MKTDSIDLKFMERAISLARLGLGNVSPNPHVGAVIVHNGKIIGEGFHRQCGHAHAEVNAVASVKESDLHLLPSSTIYVTLEPCAHYGKTPPCSKLIIDRGIRHVVVGCVDPNPKVDGGGIKMMREAGITVDILDGEIADRCRRLDPCFMSRFVNGRPFITLKWAQSADRFMADRNGHPVRFSTPLTSTLVHKLRSEHDVILTSSSTVIADNPRLDSRLWAAGQSPQRVVIDRKHRIPPESNIFSGDTRETLVYNTSIHEIVDDLGRRGYNSILVEAGPALLDSFIEAGLWDCIRVEKSCMTLDNHGGFPAPQLPHGLFSAEEIDGNTIITITR